MLVPSREHHTRPLSTRESDATGERDHGRERHLVSALATAHHPALTAAHASPHGVTDYSSPALT